MRDKLVKRWTLTPINEDEVESPLFAVSKVRDALFGSSYDWPTGLEELVRQCGASYLDCTEERTMERILEKVSDGDWLLITRTPFAPLGRKRDALPDGHFYLPKPSAPSPEQQRPEPAHLVKQRIVLRLGGTHNNAANSALGLLCGAQHPIAEEDLEASCKPYIRDPESSYGNGVTNIKLLHELYPQTPKIPPNSAARLAHRRIYIAGIGTQSGEEDNLFSGATGLGAAGVAGKVRQAFEDIQTTCHRFIGENPDYEIESLTLDIFGFSRGAAAARHFANQVAKGRNGPLSIMFPDTSGTFGAELTGRYGLSVRIAFIGLYDSVASTAGLANLGNVRSPNSPLQLYLPPKDFPVVVHLVARDEYRANFALNSTAPDHLELALPGAHADLGGGYVADVEECLLVSPMQALEVPRQTDVRHTSIYRDAERARAAWLAKGWPAEMLAIVTPDARPLPPDPLDRHAPPRKRVYAALQLKRRVRGELSRVYLRLMHRLAQQHGVRFDPIDEHDPNLSVPPELRPLCQRIIAGDYRATPDEERMLKLSYIHCSAHWNPPMRLQGQTPRTGMALTFINAPTVDGRRVIHPHSLSRSQD
ncbi:hypothetical protein D9M68_495170 [compost metagenome]